MLLVNITRSGSYVIASYIETKDKLSFYPSVIATLGHSSCVIADGSSPASVPHPSGSNAVASSPFDKKHAPNTSDDFDKSFDKGELFKCVIRLSAIVK